jgi:hypothetical protein
MTRRTVLGMLVTLVFALGPSITLAQPTSQLVLLAGPVTHVSAPLSAYETLQLTKGRVYADGFPQFPGNIGASNVYDFALALYEIYYRTGDPYWRDKARIVAAAQRDYVGNQNLNAYLAGNYKLGTISPRDMSTLGMAIFVAEAGDRATLGHRSTRQIVNDQARFSAAYFGRFHYCGPTSAPTCRNDVREPAYGLIAMLAATVLGNDHRADAKRSLDSFLAGQEPGGCWLMQQLDLVPAGPVTLNYMNGLAMEALILYDRVIGDPRIVPAIERCMNFMWTTQWVPAAQAFQYASLTSGSVNTNPYPNLNGLLLPAWGYAYAKTRNPAYKDQGDQILSGLIQPGADRSYGIYEVKQYGQMFRSSPRYFGYINEMP